MQLHNNNTNTIKAYQKQKQMTVPVEMIILVIVITNDVSNRFTNYNRNKINKTNCYESYALTI